MGKCSYCGLSAGLFSHAHAECEEKYKKGLAELLSCLSSYFRGEVSIDCVHALVRTLQSNNFLKQEDVETVCGQAVNLYADALRLPITKEHLMKVDHFLNNIGVSRTSLNKNGALDRLGTRFYQGTLMSYFVENESIDIIEKRLRIVTGLLPLSGSQKEVAGLSALDKAAHKYLADGLITESEQARLDSFSNALRLPVNNLPAAFKGSAVEKIQQSAILQKMKSGHKPPQLSCSLPILLASGEYVVWQYPDVTMCQEKITKEWVGRSRGVSVKVFKGVYYRIGGSKGRPVEHSSMEYMGTGTLVLTNKNIIFYASQRSSKVPYKKLIGVTPYSDGIELHKDGANAKRQVFQGFDSWFMMNFLSSINI